MASVTIYTKPVLGTTESDDFYSWIDLTLYHEILIAYISNNKSTGISRAQFGECRLWMLHHLAHDIIIFTNHNHSIGKYVSLYFSSKEDLSAFILSERAELAGTINQR